MLSITMYFPMSSASGLFLGAMMEITGRLWIIKMIQNVITFSECIDSISITQEWVTSSIR